MIIRYFPAIIMTRTLEIFHLKTPVKTFIIISPESQFWTLKFKTKPHLCHAPFIPQQRHEGDGSQSHP